jgi:prostaglandin-E synthase 1
MQAWLNNPAFVVYAITTVILSANLLFVWAYSGATRAKTKVAINKEDAERFGAKLETMDPPEVARVLRVHANAQATVYPFLFLGLVFVLAGGSGGFAKVDFGIFVAARITHSIVYLAGKQPWRTLSFVASGLAMIALMGNIVWMVSQGPPGHHASGDMSWARRALWP